MNLGVWADGLYGFPGWQVLHITQFAKVVACQYFTLADMFRELIDADAETVQRFCYMEDGIALYAAVPVGTETGHGVEFERVDSALGIQDFFMDVHADHFADHEIA